MLMVLLASCSSSPEPAAEPAAVFPPDVVLITIDTLRPRNLPTYGYARPTAPFLERLGSEGHVFEQAWSTSSWTAPSTASLFTSLHPKQHGVTVGMFFSMWLNEGQSVEINAMATQVQTLPEMFEAHGYTTRAAVSNINIGAQMGFERGFDTFVGERKATAEELFLQVRGWPATEGPTFTYLHLNDVHHPYDKHEAWYSEDGATPRMALYDSEISYLDDQLASIYADMGWEDAVVVVVSDHGEEFFEHGRPDHDFSLHRELTHVVMMARGPGVSVGRTSTNTSLIDVLPTLCQLTGMPIPAHAEGRSLVPALQGGSLEGIPVFSHRRRPLESGLEREIWAITTADRRLIRGEHEVTGTSGEALLYALDDTLERTKLSVAEDDPLVAALNAFEARLKPIGSETSQLEMTEDTVEHLKLLGYVD